MEMAQWLLLDLLSLQWLEVCTKVETRQRHAGALGRWFICCEISTKFTGYWRSSSSSVGPVANATDVLQPSGLLDSPHGPPPRLDVHTFAARHTHVPNEARDPSSKRWNCVGENWPVILPEIVTSTSIQGSFTCCKSAKWDPRFYFPSEGRRAKDFFALKNHDGFSRV